MIKVTKFFTERIRSTIIGWWGFVCLLLGYCIGSPSRATGVALLFSIAAFCFAASWLSTRIANIEKRLNSLEEGNDMRIAPESDGRF